MPKRLPWTKKITLIVEGHGHKLETIYVLPDYTFRRYGGPGSGLLPPKAPRLPATDWADHNGPERLRRHQREVGAVLQEWRRRRSEGLTIRVEARNRNRNRN